jgi:hypothetical protein
MVAIGSPQQLQWYNDDNGNNNYAIVVFGDVAAEIKQFGQLVKNRSNKTVYLCQSVSLSCCCNRGWRWQPSCGVHCSLLQQQKAGGVLFVLVVVIIKILLLLLEIVNVDKQTKTSQPVHHTLFGCLFFQGWTIVKTPF